VFIRCGSGTRDRGRNSSFNASDCISGTRINPDVSWLKIFFLIFILKKVGHGFRNYDKR
jgi:hypothetical protein